MKSQTKPKIIYVAMSGGVDSSVAAALLKRQSFNVVGVFMKPWSPQIRNSKFEFRNSACLWQGDREEAMRAASVLGIPLLTWDFSKEYKKEVGDYMIREYRSGRTPNPDVMCNKEIKFGLFLKKALVEGADYIATGHYIRIQSQHGPVSAQAIPEEVPPCEPSPLHPHRAHYHSGGDSPEVLPVNLRLTALGSPSRATPLGLYMAKDKNKDQSYFLWTLTQKQLNHCLFPIGDYVKPEVRKMAKKFGLPNHDKKDSQGVCFIGPLDMKEFLKKYIKPKKGDIQLLKKMSPSINSGRSNHFKTIGSHDGAYYYTIGQRHGLDIKNGQGPYYVVGKDLKKNIVYVGKEKDLAEKEAKIIGINWINPTWKLSFQVKGSVEVDVKIRYRSESEKAVLYKNGSLKFKSLVRAITPGQSAVFYKGQEMLGGGIIE